MKLNSSGVNPLIAAILLIVVTMAIGGLYMGWTMTYYQNQLANQQKLSDQQIECSEAGFQINSCSFDAGDTNIATVQLENTGYVDLNEFTVVAQYSNGESDTNICAIDLEESAYGNAFIQLEAGKSPYKIKVASRDCTSLEDSTKDCS